MTENEAVSPEKRAAIDAMVNDPRNWMTNAEKEKFLASGLDVEQWIQSAYKVSSKTFIHWKRTDAKRKSSLPKDMELPAPAISRCKKRNQENVNHEIGLFKQYTTITPTKRKITITKLSRPFIGDEEDVHRCRMCDDAEVKECLTFAISLNIDYFSCVNCKHYKLNPAG